MPRASSSTSPARANRKSMMAPSTVPLIADSRFCFSEKPRVSAAKMGARPSGSTTTSSVTKALNTNSIGRDFTSQRRTCVGDNTPLAPQRPRPVHGLLPDPTFLRLVTPAHLHRERLYHPRHVRRQVPDTLGSER